jgi:hypothetical protein
MIGVVPYTKSRKAEWDAFIDTSKNGSFLFRRDYMEYHSSRFDDASLMFIDDAHDLVAVMPASIEGSHVVSHAGLTFGGIVSNRRMRAKTMIGIFEALTVHARGSGVAMLTYKRVPYIYHDVPADEDRYALFRYGARLVRCDLSVAVAQSDRLPYTKGRKWAVNKSRKCGVMVSESDTIEAFMEMETEHLQSKFGTKPVHSSAEMRLLASLFPRNIRLFTASMDNRLLAGLLVYESRNVAHAQYIGTTEEGRELCALDAVVDHLLGIVYAGKRYFDFGTSNEQSGRYLNEGLIDNKESYGARGVAHEFFELTFEEA